MSAPLKSSIMFRGNALEAMRFYASVFPDFQEKSIARMPENGPAEPGAVLAVNFSMMGMEFVGINADFGYVHDEAISFVISTGTQAETDKYWNALIADGGEESQCGWLKDKFGISWQVTPTRLIELLGDSDPARAGRAMEAMLQMRKIDIATLESAANGSADGR